MVERLAERASLSLTRLLTVGVTQMTFFWHFPAKELVVDDPYDPGIAQAVAVQRLICRLVERVDTRLRIRLSESNR
jgi:AcrR family transcriptional regulator